MNPETTDAAFAADNGPHAYVLNRVHHLYGSRTALGIEHLTLEAGSITGLMGPNGSGKSTLLALLSFTLRPSSGEILYRGRPEHPFSERVRSRITLLTQKPYLLKRSVFDNAAYGLRVRGDRGDLTRAVHGALESVGLDPAVFCKRAWNELSGGEAQRVALAARLALQPEVLLLDEPTASVDAVSARLIREASLKARRDWGTTLVIASHDLTWLSEICDCLLHLFQGRVVRAGREIVVPGPFTPTPDEGFLKTLGPELSIAFPPPPRTDAQALVPESGIRLFPWGGPEPRGTLRATVLSMTLERVTGGILTGMKLGDLPFTLTLDRDTVAGLGLQPGTSLGILMDTRDVTWL
jgi:tungstate transport system ATP-binding protein